MEFSLAGDLVQLDRLAFKRRVRTEALLRSIHRAMINSASESERTRLGTIRSWLLVPYTLCPVDFASVGEHVVRLHREGKPIPADLGFTLERIQSLPTVEEQASVAKYEHLVEQGRLACPRLERCSPVASTRSSASFFSVGAGIA